MSNVLLVYGDNEGERKIVEVLTEGIELYGHAVTQMRRKGVSKKITNAYDLVFTGRVTTSRRVVRRCRKFQIPYVYFDKGYTHRGWGSDETRKVYYRFSVNDFHPLHYFQSIPRPDDRWKKLGIQLEPRRSGGEHIIYAGCSKKFANIHHFDPNEYAVHIINEIRRFSARPIIHRPKPSDRGARHVPGSIFSQGERTIEEELKNAYALVTFSSNAAMDAIFHGIPAFVLGPGIARLVSNIDLSRLNDPYFPSERERYQWCCDLAYCQWTINEIREGTLWQDLRQIIAREKSIREGQEINQALLMSHSPNPLPDLEV